MLLVSFFAISVLLTKSTTAEVVGVWLFDEGNGKIVKDASGKGHDGEIVGEVAWTEGKFGTGLEFDSGYVIVPHEDIMNLRQWTITAWIKVPAIVDPYQKNHFQTKLAKSKLCDVDPSRHDDFWI
jgi:hypothetical protein